MADTLELVHLSGGLLSPAILADALSDAPRRGEFQPSKFGWSSHDPEPPKQFAENLEATFQLACEHYDGIAKNLDTMSVSDLREKWLRQLLRLLDFKETYHPKLKSQDGRDCFDINFLGWEAKGAPPIHLVKGGLDDALGRGGKSPHEELQQYLNASPKTWGIVANGRQLRLLRDFHHVFTKAFVGFDLDAIFETRDFAAFRALFRFCHRSRFELASDREKIPLETLFESSQVEGIQIGRQLQPQVRGAIEALAEGLFSPQLRQMLDDPKTARALFHELMLVIYRILFLLFAEQRRMLPAEGLYSETYSLAALARLAERKTVELHRCDLWEGLKVTFKMLSQGAPEIEVFAFNGQLFDLNRTHHLMEQSCENKFLLKAIEKLTHVRVENFQQRVNYAVLGVEELGSVYETLLSYTLRVAQAPTEADGYIVPTGAVYLASLSTERKDLGAHYTRPALVDFLLSVSLDKLITERLGAADNDKKARVEALLDIRVCDPACGSGAILVGAIDRLALALATVRTGGDKPTEARLQEARRDVLAHCIYGVDKDAFAAELCKVALWIHCTVPNLPLSFLDHRIQHGDALVGWPLLNVPSMIPRDAYTVPSNAGRDEEARRLKAFLQGAYHANDLAIQGQGELGQLLPKPDIRTDFPAVMAEEERIPGDVEKKDAAFKGYMESEPYRRFKAAADLWAAAFFWSSEVGSPAPTTEDYRRALSGKYSDDQVKAAEDLLEEFPAFHWPLRFPEIAARGGFDSFVGNPPWEQFENREQEWFAARAPDIAALKGAERKVAIERLRVDRPELSRRWRIYERLNQRMAEFTRTCERFTPIEGKANTYMLFTELAADALRVNGRAGIIVKTAFGTDKGAMPIFHRLVKNDQIEEFHDHINGGPTGSTLIFADVDAKERFVVLSLRGRAASDGQARGLHATLMNWNVEEARSRPRQHITFDILQTLNPRTATLTSFRRPEEFRVAVDIHQRATNSGTLSHLDCGEGGANPWALRYATLFNATTDSGLFKKPDVLMQAGWELGKDMIFRRKRRQEESSEEIGLALFDKPSEIEEALPLYEGQLSNRYDHRAKTYTGYDGPNKYGVSPGALETTDDQKAWPTFEIEPRYWMHNSDVNARLRVFGDKVFIAFRDVGAPWRNQRTLKAALIPRYPATHKLPIFAIARDSACGFLAVFNSTICDFLVRGHMPGASAALLWMLSQIPAPLPDTFDERVAEHAAKLSLTSHSVARLFNRDPHSWSKEERHALDVEIDALIAHAYTLTRAQYEVVLDSFEVLARIEIGKHGRYKFKEDCLAAYSRAG
jgi:hypothetical protein